MNILIVKPVVGDMAYGADCSSACHVILTAKIDARLE